MKSKWWIISALLTFTLLASGCSGNDGTSGDGGSDGETEDGKTEVTLAGWSSSPEEEKLLQQQLDDFEEEHPDITVKHEVIADQYMDVLKTRLVGGEGPDVFYLDAVEAPALIETGVLEPLNSYVEDDFDAEDFEENLIDPFKDEEDEVYGFPKGYSTLGLFYNKEMLDEAGVEVPTNWEELEEAAKELTTEDTVGLGVSPEMARNQFIGESGSGDMVTEGEANFGSQEVIDALQPLVDLRNEDEAAAAPSEMGSESTGEMLGQGRAAMVMEGNWNVPYLNETFPDMEYGVAEVPTFDDTEATMAYTVSYVMNQASEQKEASWELISYLTGKEGMKTWTESGLELPARQSVAEELGYEEDEVRGPLVEGAEYATAWSDGPNLPTIYNNFDNEFLSAFLGEKSLEDALETGEEVANDEISD
ncbi:ABC transporter substrate-binding protein [Halobacillus sp. A5]|uniref:ABC transporter substrate-binding protein n=1 Tax=Halobacillus sp. A5 TaxID=2880263 RepID=UPI0020A6217D|nr:ABC transporter substrate-binding protein [Halobacillus sp. A5]MCP3028221.1 ABC transporter substrate-binding protein [Halobacillus sp. A5]